MVWVSGADRKITELDGGKRAGNLVATDGKYLIFD